MKEGDRGELIFFLLFFKMKNQRYKDADVAVSIVLEKKRNKKETFG